MKKNLLVILFVAFALILVSCPGKDKVETNENSTVEPSCDCPPEGHLPGCPMYQEPGETTEKPCDPPAETPEEPVVPPAETPDEPAEPPVETPDEPADPPTEPDAKTPPMEPLATK